MQYSKALMWKSFFGTLIVIGLVALVLSLKDVPRMMRLEKQYGGWSIVEGKVLAFQAHFPGKPEYAAQDLPIETSDQVMKQEMYVSGDDHASYFVSATQYPTDISSDGEETLRKSLQGMTQAIPDGQVISSRYVVPLWGTNYLEYKIHSTQNGTSYKGRMFLSARSLYQVYISYKEIGYDDDSFTYFANSFRIK